MKRHICSSEEFRYRFKKPSLRNYVFRGTASEERGGLIFGHITKITPYDEEEFESFDEYIDYILETTAEELVNFNKNIEPVMVHY